MDEICRHSDELIAVISDEQYYRERWSKELGAGKLLSDESPKGKKYMKPDEQAEASMNLRQQLDAGKPDCLFEED